MNRARVAIRLRAAIVVAGSAAVWGLWAPAPPSAAPSGAMQPVWTETKWPFLQDQWGIGKAFVCMPADCGVKINLFSRPKIGFCNCSTGVSDDAELERVADTEFIASKV